MDVQEEVLTAHEQRTLEAKMALVTALMSTVIFNESLDSLKDSSFYDGKLKTIGNQFEIQIMNKCKKQVDHLWNVNDKASCDLTSSIRDIAEHISKLKPSAIVALSQAMNRGLVKVQ